MEGFFSFPRKRKSNEKVTQRFRLRNTVFLRSQWTSEQIGEYRREMEVGGSLRREDKAEFMSSGSSNLQIAGAECEESDPLTTRQQCVPRTTLTIRSSACGTCTTMMCDGADWYIRPVFLDPQYPLPTLPHLDGWTLDKDLS